MKKAILILLLFLVSIFSVVVLAEEVTKDTLEFEDNAINDELITDNVIDSALSEEVSTTPDNRFGWALKRFRENLDYAFTFNKEKKVEKAFEIAKQRMLEANKMVSENKEEAALKAQEKYELWIEKARNQIDNMPEKASLQANELLQARVELHEKMLERVQEKIKDSNLTGEKKSRIEEKVKTSLENAIKIKLAIAKKNKLLGKLAKEKQGLSDEDVEKIKIEAKAEIVGKVGEKQVAEVFIRIAKRDLERAEKIVADQDTHEKALAILENATTHITSAEKSFEAGNYAEAKKQAILARKTLMNAYIRSRYNSLSDEQKQRLRNLSEDDKQEIQERLREKLSDKKKDLRDRIEQRLEKLREKTREVEDNAKERIRETFKERIETRVQNVKERIEAGEADAGEKVCVQVISYGINPKTRECMKFSTPCDIPTGYKRVMSCTDAVANTVVTDDTAITNSNSNGENTVNSTI